jgi:cyclopropane fatty-acyl-phospholipid synthase-like methyltransferase
VGFDRQYEDVKDLFGASPEPLLERHREAIDPGRAALDLGAGQGRNTFYLARHGIEVHALDPSRVAADAVRAVAERESLPVTAYVTDFQSFVAPVPSYSAVLAFGLMPLLDWKSVDALGRSLTTWTSTDSLVFVTGFTTDDPRFDEVARSCQRVGENSFARPDGELRTYLKPGQARGLFDGFELLHHWEGLGPEHQHGDSPPERHGMFELVLKR